MQDIQSFLKNDIIKTMTIVTNKGNVWYMSKNDGYNRSGAYALMRKIVEEKGADYDAIVEEFLKQSYNLGIERN